MNKLDLDYQALLQDITTNGVVKKDRTGTGTVSVFGRQIRHKMSDGFPLLTTKKMAFKSMVVELLWFLKGDTNIRYLVTNNCHIWNGDAYKNYCKYTSGNDSIWNKWMRDNGDDTLSMYTKAEFIEKIKTDIEFAEKWGDLGPIYGKQWRCWEQYGYEFEEGKIVVKNKIDQLQNLVNDLRNNPDSRRMMVSAWNPAEIESAVLPPCHYGFQLYTKELSLEERIVYFRDKIAEAGEGWPGETDNLINFLNEKNVPTRSISLQWQQRSADFLLGIPFNIASYGLLLEILGKMANMVPDELIGSLGDTHLYSNHLEHAKEQITRKPFELPILKIGKSDAFWKNDMNTMSVHLDYTDFAIENYISHEAIKADLSN